MRRPTAQEEALRICVEFVKEIDARMRDPKARWSTVDLACLCARAEAAEEIAKKIRKIGPNKEVNR